jgi:hypothetical protein
VQPVRVKIYGLFSFTRRGYLREAIVEGLLLVAVVSVWVLGWEDCRKTLLLLEPQTPWTTRTIALFDVLPWILLGAVLAKALEMTLVLRAFARKEQAARLAASAPPPLSAPDTGGTSSSIVSTEPPPPTPPVSAGSG